MTTDNKIFKRIIDGEIITEADFVNMNGSAPIARQLYQAKSKGRPDDELAKILIDAKWVDADIKEVFGMGGERNDDAPKLTTTPGKALYDRVYPPRQFLIDGILARGNLAMLGGRPKSGKSWLSFQLAQAIDAGAPFLGKATTKTNVLYMALEDGDRRIHERLHIRRWIPQHVNFVFTALPLDDGKGNTGTGFEQIMNTATSLGTGLVIIDTLRSSMSGHVDESDNAGMAAILNPLANFAHDKNVSILINHHTTKGATDDIFNSFRGASSIRGAYDLGAILERKNKELEATLKFESRDAEIDDMTIVFEPATGWRYEGDIKRIDEITAGRKVVKALSDMGGGKYSCDEIAKQMGITLQGAREQLRAALRDGHVQRKDGAKAANGKAIDMWSLK